MTYEESANLIMDLQFRGRIKVACLTYAKKILTDGGGNQSQNAAAQWANSTYRSPDQIAVQTQGPAVMEPGVQSLGADIDDSGLQFAVESAVNKML